ncbi:hypothetical protein EES45_35330 [Streptomyces sp. ADI97-07]|nr:hypothetical protein EES45_35330 [Streptomyces sp. ADI97-07]
MVVADEPVAPGCFLDTADLQALSLLDDPDEFRGLHHRGERPGVQPRGSAVQDGHGEFTAAQVGLVDLGDLQLAPCTGQEGPCDLHDTVVVEVEAGDHVPGFGVCGLLLDGQDVSLAVEVQYAERARVRDRVGEDVPALGGGVCFELFPEAHAVEDVVAEDERDRFVPDEVRPDQERLRDASGAGLRRVLDLQAQLRSVAQQPLEGVPFGGHGDDEDVPHACQYQGGQGVVDHRLVEYRHELFRHDLGDRPQPGAGPAGQDDASHVREAKDAAYSADRGRVGAGLLLWVLRAAGAVRARGPLWCSSGVRGVRGGRLRGGPGPAGRGSALAAGSVRCGTEGGGGGRGFCSSPMRRGRMLRLGWLCGTRPAVSRGRGRETTASAERASAALARSGLLFGRGGRHQWGRVRVRVCPSRFGARRSAHRG